MYPPIPGYTVYVEVKRSIHTPDRTTIIVGWYGNGPRDVYEFTAERREPGSVMWELEWEGDSTASTVSTVIEAREFHEFAQYAFNWSERIRNAGK
jgi:hypothetical protein